MGRFCRKTMGQPEYIQMSTSSRDMLSLKLLSPLGFQEPGLAQVKTVCFPSALNVVCQGEASMRPETDPVGSSAQGGGPKGPSPVCFVSGPLPFPLIHIMEILDSHEMLSSARAGVLICFVH